MAIDLLSIKPVKISTDLSSYSMFIYGDVKSGKSTFVNELYGDRVLNIMTESRYKTIVGAHVQVVHSWSEFLMVMSQIRKPEVKKLYDVISVDTVDNLWDMLEKYVANKHEEGSVGERDDLWGRDWGDLKKEWKNGLGMIETAGYTPCFVSHSIQKTIQVPKSSILAGEADGIPITKEGIDKTGTAYLEFEQYRPDLKDSAMAPINKMVDNILFITTGVDSNGQETQILNLRSSLQWIAGSTFKGIQSPIKFNVDSYRKAVKDAIDLVEPSNQTDVEQSNHSEKVEKLDFKQLQATANDIAMLFYKDGSMDLVTDIVESVFGKDKKLTEAQPKQVELLSVATQQMEALAIEKGLK